MRKIGAVSRSAAAAPRRRSSAPTTASCAATAPSASRRSSNALQVSRGGFLGSASASPSCMRPCTIFFTLGREENSVPLMTCLSTTSTSSVRKASWNGSNKGLEKRRWLSSGAALEDHDVPSSSLPPQPTASPVGSAARGGGARGTVPFLLADIGEGIKEVELLQWYVQPGDHVRQFDRICEVQSDKATVEITSRYDGVVSELSGEVGDMMQVGKPLMHIRTEAGAGGAGAQPAPSPQPPANRSSGASSAVASSAQQAERTLSAMLRADAAGDGANELERLNIPTIASHYRLDSDEDAAVANAGRLNHQAVSDDARRSSFQASPAVRKLGKEYQLDLATIHPSGPHGRLLKSDVVTYLKEQGRWKGVEEPSAFHSPQLGSVAPSRPPDLLRAHDENVEDRIVQLKGYHRLMMQSMTAALQIPHMGFGDELVVTELVRCRRELNDSLQRQPASSEDSEPAKLRLSMLTLLIKACSLALAEHPMVNAVVHDAEACQLRLPSNHNIGIAVDTHRGLVVPVIHSVQKKSLVEIQEALNELKRKARDSKLSNDDLQNATFTISNIGVIGGTYMTPVIVPPQVAMGAVGKVQTLPRFDRNGNVAAEDVMHVSWAADHRFLDGATLARFHTSFKRYVENPTLMLLRTK